MAAAPFPLPLAKGSGIDPTKVKFRWETHENVGFGGLIREHWAPCAYGDKVYFFGGRAIDRDDPGALPKAHALQHIRVFDTKLNKWERMIETEHTFPAKVHGGYNPGAVALASNGLIAVVSDKIWVFFDPKTNTWVKDMVFEDKSESMFPQLGEGVLDGKIAVIWDNKEAMTTVNLETGDFCRLPPWGDVPFDQHHVHPFVVKDKLICLDLSTYRASPKVYAFNPADAQWRQLSRDTSALEPSGCIGFELLRVGPLVLSVNASWDKPFQIAKFNVFTGTWSQDAPLPGAPIHKATCTPVRVGDKVYWWGTEKTDSMHILHIEHDVRSLSLS